jgi:hypothetical protein
MPLLMLCLFELLLCLQLIRCEVDKEQLESEIRAEVQAEMAELIQAATAAEKARADRAREEDAAARAEAAAAQEAATAAREEAAASAAEAAATLAGVDAARQKAASWEQKVGAGLLSRFRAVHGLYAEFVVATRVARLAQASCVCQQATCSAFSACCYALPGADP